MNRLEIKYIINDIDRITALSFLDNNAQIDAHCVNGKYYVQTTYLLNWKTAGLHGRIRARKYTFGNENSYFLENKYRDELGQHKKRVKISEIEYARIVTNPNGFLISEADLKDIFFFKNYSFVETQNILFSVSYTRKAYRIIINNEAVRITIDSHLTAIKNDNTICLLAKGYSIMEIKGRSIDKRSVGLFNLQVPVLFGGSKYKLTSQAVLLKDKIYNDIIESELKLSVPNDVSFKTIYASLSERYDVSPYDYSIVYDTYYDTDKLHLLKRGCSFRYRKKRNASINFKTKGHKYEKIWSRREYRDAIAVKGVNSQDVLFYNNRTGEIVKEFLSICDLSVLHESCVIVSKRTSYLLKTKDIDETLKADIIGVCTFDEFYNLSRPDRIHKEVEIEICNDLVSPYVFADIINIGKDLCAICPLSESKHSKYETIMTEQLTGYLC